MIGWVLTGGRAVPSARIQGWNLHDQLVRSGESSVIVCQLPDFTERLRADDVPLILEKCRRDAVNVLVLQKAGGPEAVKLVAAARAEGIRVVYLACDSIDNALADACDQTLAVSSFLRGLFARRVRARIAVLDDAIDVPERFRDRDLVIPASGRLKAVYLASQYPDAETQGILHACAERMDVTVIASQARTDEGSKPTPSPATGSSARLFGALRRHGLKVVPLAFGKLRYSYRTWAMQCPITTESTSPLGFRKWQLDAVNDALSEFHVGLLPIVLNSNFRMAKSANRLATLLAVGLPTIASPVPSYREAATDGEHVLFAHTAAQWRQRVRTLDEDREVSRQLGQRGRKLAWQRFAPEVIAAKFRRLISL